MTSYTCTICQDIYYLPTTLQCGHSFCQLCIQEQFKVKPQCPVCRKILFSTQFNINYTLLEIIKEQFNERYNQREKEMEIKYQVVNEENKRGQIGNRIVLFQEDDTWVFPNNRQQIEVKQNSTQLNSELEVILLNKEQVKKQGQKIGVLGVIKQMTYDNNVSKIDFQAKDSRVLLNQIQDLEAGNGQVLKVCNDAQYYEDEEIQSNSELEQQQILKIYQEISQCLSSHIERNSMNYRSQIELNQRIEQNNLSQLLGESHSTISVKNISTFSLSLSGFINISRKLYPILFESQQCLKRLQVLKNEVKLLVQTDNLQIIFSQQEPSSEYYIWKKLFILILLIAWIKQDYIFQLQSQFI